jgi:3-hydroxyisobutyrate dehydrogenase-like beta-hydroxyacid dehydrogenase
LSDARDIPTVGFIGVGAMGGPMARSVMKAGYTVVAFDVRRNASEALQRDGAKVATDAKELARSCSVIITMLPNPQAVRDTIFGSNGILSEINDKHIVIEMSTIDLKLTLDLAKSIEEHGGMFLDAPVAGTPDKVDTRDLEIVVSGDNKAAFEKCANLFDSLGKRVVYVGKAGNGKIVKLTVNAMIAINKLAAIEATSVALKNGIDPEVLLDIVGNSTANSVVFERYGRTILGQATPFSNRHSWHLKDLQLMGDLCNDSSCAFFLGGLAHEIIQSSCNEQPEKVESLGASVEYYRRVNGMPNSK